jgi:hypothetical protein
MLVDLWRAAAESAGRRFENGPWVWKMARKYKKDTK